MTINLNKLNKKLLSKEEIFKHVSDWEIFTWYTGYGRNLKLNTVFSSPLRTDNKPSFGLFIGENNEICFKDFNVTSGDCVKLVQLLYGLNYYEALSKIAIDMGIDEDYIVKRNLNTDYNLVKKEDNSYIKTRDEIIRDLNTYKLGKKSRNWNSKDLIYWDKYGIHLNTLKKYNVSPISHIFIGERIISCKQHSYCFTEFKDKTETYKIYQPLENKYKWLNNHNSSVWQGWTQLPIKGEILIITKSLKDVMAIVSNTKYSAVALQNEGVFPKEKIIDELRSRFDYIFILYDNDFDKEYNWGREFGKKIATEFGLFQIEINDKYKSKDFTDLILNHGVKIANKHLKEIIENPFDNGKKTFNSSM